MIRSAYPTTLIVARHAEAQKNIDRRHGGGDQALTERGIEQARHIGNTLLGSGLVKLDRTRIVHQSEERSKNTAKIFHEIIGGTLNEEPVLNGIGLGDRAGMSEDELAKAYPELSQALDAWVVGEGFNIPSANGGEPMLDFAIRISDGLQRQLEDTESGQALALVGTTSSLTMVNHLLVEDGEFIQDKYLYYGAKLGTYACWEISNDRPMRVNI